MPIAERLVHKGDEAGEGGVGAADDGTRRHLEHGAQRLELRGEAAAQQPAERSEDGDGGAFVALSAAKRLK